MKNGFRPVIYLLLVTLIPSICFHFMLKDSTLPQLDSTEHWTPPTVEREPTEVEVSVLTDRGVIRDMVLDDYITGVVLREMPAEFETEALKAQAVVARTYTLRRADTGGKHDLAVVCTDPSCCQGYWDPEEYMENGGDPALLNKVREAVVDTSGLILIYNGSLIEATYFSCSGGMTEDAAAVWGTDIPYLRATKSPGEEMASHFTDTVTFTAEEFETCLGGRFVGSPGTWIEGVSYTAGNGVARMRICGVDYSGTELREKLGLRSTAFMISAIGSNITITTKGYGHRVGMSQYGAEAMAVQGKSFDEILTYYYSGAELVSYSRD